VFTQNVLVEKNRAFGMLAPQDVVQYRSPGSLLIVFIIFIVGKGFEERNCALKKEVKHRIEEKKTRKINNCLEKLQAILEPWIQEMKVIHGPKP
jgi:hypothetical protein